MTFRREVRLNPNRVKDNRRHGAVTRRSDGPIRPPKQGGGGGGVKRKK